MSRTPETITNKTAAFIRGVFVVLGFFFGFAALGALQAGGNAFFPIVLCIGAFIIAANIKVTWKKDAEVGRYR